MLEQKKLAHTVQAAEDKYFGPFREKTGMTDLKAYERANRERRDVFNEERRRLSEHIMHLEQQRDYESKRDFQKPIANLEKRLRGYKKKLSDAKAKQKELVKETKEVAKALEEAQKAHAVAFEKEEEFENQVKEAQAGYKEAQKERTHVSKAISTEESKLEQLRGKLHETLQKARVEEVYLPLAVSSSQGSRTTRSGQSFLATDSDEEMDDDDGPESQAGSQLSTLEPTAIGTATQFSQEDNPKVVQDRSNVAKLDFSQLNSALKQKLSDREERQVRKDYEDKRLKIEAELEGLVPNMKVREGFGSGIFFRVMSIFQSFVLTFRIQPSLEMLFIMNKAAEQFSNVTDKLKASGTDYEKAKEASRKATRAFQKIKKERTKRFMDCFNHIDAELKTIYTDMTKSSKHPLGGNAYLSLDDTEEPYKGGMKFNAMPPMKRFRDMYQLSGGEKTVASLALLFAIHSYRPAPFFVMDEVDAALDNSKSSVLNDCCFLRFKISQHSSFRIYLSLRVFHRVKSIFERFATTFSNAVRPTFNASSLV
jgi:structural maintenance of chromosome 1